MERKARWTATGSDSPDLTDAVEIAFFCLSGGAEVSLYQDQDGVLWSRWEKGSEVIWSFTDLSLSAF